MRENRRIIHCDACAAPPVRSFCRKPVQVATWLEIENLYLRHQLNIAMRRVLSEIISGRNGGAVRGRLADTRWEGLNERARQVGLDLMELGRRALS
jgi:hypothetical protein